MNVIRKNKVEDWTVGSIVKYDNKYCLIIEVDFVCEKFGLLNVETDNVVHVFNSIDELYNVEVIANDTDVDICF